jgi:hypothetical protein
LQVVADSRHHKPLYVRWWTELIICPAAYMQRLLNTNSID